MNTRVVYSGCSRTIEALCHPDGSCPVGDFLDGLSAADRKKVDTILELMAEKGRISNEEKFKKLEGSDRIFEFKSFQIRLLCFYAPNGRVILCRAVIKKRDRHAPSDISFAEQCRKDFSGE